MTTTTKKKKKPTMKVEKNETATGNSGENEMVGNGMIGVENEPELTEEQYKQLRSEAKQACGVELKELLDKYGCSLKAQLTLTEHGNVSQVFIVDA